MESQSSKFYNKFVKLSNKYIKKVPYMEYHNPNISISKIHGWRDDLDVGMYIYTENALYFDRRKLMVKVLKDINYHRQGKNWSVSDGICFMHEVIEMEKKVPSMTVEEHKAMMKEIGERYNVAPNRLKSTVALFLLNLRKGSDKFHIYSYFTFYEILVYQYRDTETLQEALENNKLLPIEERIVSEILDI